MLRKLNITLSRKVDTEEDGSDVHNVLADGTKIGTAYKSPDGKLTILAETDNNVIDEELRRQLKTCFPNATVEIYGIDYD